MEDFGTLETFLPIMSNSPIVFKANELKTMYNSGKTTPTSRQRSSRPNKLIQQVDVKIKDCKKSKIDARGPLFTHKSPKSLRKSGTPISDINSLDNSPTLYNNSVDYHYIKSKAKTI